MKQLLITIAAVILVGCGDSQKANKSSTAKIKPKSIHQAIQLNDIDAVKNYLANGVDVNSRDESDWTLSLIHI